MGAFVLAENLMSLPPVPPEDEVKDAILRLRKTVRDYIGKDWGVNAACARLLDTSGSTFQGWVEWAEGKSQDGPSRRSRQIILMNFKSITEEKFRKCVW